MFQCLQCHWDPFLAKLRTALIRWTSHRTDGSTVRDHYGLDALLQHYLRYAWNPRAPHSRKSRWEGKLGQKKKWTVFEQSSTQKEENKKPLERVGDTCHYPARPFLQAPVPRLLEVMKWVEEWGQRRPMKLVRVWGQAPYEIMIMSRTFRPEAQ